MLKTGFSEIFYSKEFNDSVTPAAAAFQAVREQAEKWSSSVVPNLAQPKSHKPNVRNIQDVARDFPEDLVSEVSVEDGVENIIVKPK